MDDCREIRDASTGRLLLSQVGVAAPCTWAGLRGLIGRPALGDDEGLLLHDAIGCIHTFGMRCPIDIVFLSAQLTVVAVASRVPPGRLRWQPGAPVQLELRAGRADELALAPGSQIRVDERSAAATGGQKSARSPQPAGATGGAAHKRLKAACQGRVGRRTVRLLPRSGAALHGSQTATDRVNQEDRR